MLHAETQHQETLGRSDGTPGQRFVLQRRPVLAADTPGIARGADRGRGADLDRGRLTSPSPVRTTGTTGSTRPPARCSSGPRCGSADGGLQHYGAVPPRGATLVVTSYRSGGGRRGNIARGQVRVLKTSVPYVARVENRAPAVGGADAETLDDAKVRGPMLLRSRGRAVTAEDFVQLTHEVAPEVARVHCFARRRRRAGAGACACSSCRT